MELKINPKFRDVLPKLTPAEADRLKADIIEKGCITPLLVWDDVIIDGHNRYGICAENNIEFETQPIDFDSEDEAILWICLHQLARRNLHPRDRAEILGRYNLLRSKGVGAPKGSRNAAKINGVTVTPLISETKRTRDEIAKEAGVSPSTIDKSTAYVKALDRLPEEDKAKARSGEMSQKETIEKAKELREPKVEKPTPANLDSFTNNAQFHGKQILKSITELEMAISAARTYFSAENVEFFKFGKNLCTSKTLSDMAHEAEILKRLVKCSGCDSRGCDLCVDGYVFKSTDKSNQDLIEQRNETAALSNGSN